MSDLAATNCGCGCGCECNNGGSGCNFIWLILILCCCCGGGGGFGGGCGCGGGSNCGCGCGGSNGCDFIWIILLLCCCGGGGGRSFSFIRILQQGGKRTITAPDSYPVPVRPADFLHFLRVRNFFPVFSLRTRRQFHILHCHL